jgi:uncharacterized RDD family membrane protein YckC
MRTTRPASAHARAAFALDELGRPVSRVLARLTDWALLAATTLSLGALFGDHPTATQASVLVLLPIAYEVLLIAWFGQTVGKRLLRLRVVVVKDRTARVGTTRGVLRYAVVAVPGFIAVLRPFAPLWWCVVFGVSFLSLDRRGLHDALAGTAVLKHPLPVGNSPE